MNLRTLFYYGARATDDLHQEYAKLKLYIGATYYYIIIVHVLRNRIRIGQIIYYKEPDKRLGPATIKIYNIIIIISDMHTQNYKFNIVKLKVLRVDLIRK